MQRIKSPKLSDVIRERLESMILDGTFVPGQKLPPERELAEQFEVSRPSLREAIQQLEVKDLVERKQGGGTFVKRRLTATVSDPLLDLISSHPETQFDLLEFRHGLEGMSAYYAALRAQPQDLALLQKDYQQVTRLQEGSADIDTEAEALAGFYLSMVKATQNVVLLHVMRSLLPLMQDNIRANLLAFSGQAEVGQCIRDYRDGIVNAIVAGNPDEARKGSTELLDYIEQTLLSMNQQDRRIQRALRRIDLTPNSKSLKDKE